MKQAEVHELFKEHGLIDRLMFSFDLNHKSKGYGFCYYKDHTCAQKAIEKGAHLGDD